MDGIIELAMSVGRLEQRVCELEKLLKEERKEQGAVLNPCVATLHNVTSEETSDEMTPDKLLQQGIDNIMGYPWNLSSGGR